MNLLSLLVAASQVATVPSAAPVIHEPAVVFTAGLERRSEHDRFHFENDSSFGTSELVPHFFEQRYDAGVWWLRAAAAYRLSTVSARTEFGITPRIRTPGSDIDTFFLSSGDVVTSGTRGVVVLRSMSVSQRLGLATWRAWTFGVTLAYRRSRADFPPDYRLVTHTKPPSEVREFTAARETAILHVFESGLTAEALFWPDSRWHGTVGGDLAPTTRAWLIIRLPDKYPDDIVTSAFAFGANGRATLERQLKHVTAGVGVSFGGTWGYRRAVNYRQHGVGASAFIRVGT